VDSGRGRDGNWAPGRKTLIPARRGCLLAPAQTIKKTGERIRRHENSDGGNRQKWAPGGMTEGGERGVRHSTCGRTVPLQGGQGCRLLGGKKIGALGVNQGLEGGEGETEE